MGARGACAILSTIAEAEMHFGLYPRRKEFPMRSGGHIWIVLVALGLAACARPAPGPGGAGTPTALPSPTPSPSPEATAAAPATATPPATPDLQRILFPTPEDWSKGAPDARVTFIEWGDFQ